jgi:serine protease Do
VKWLWALIVIPLLVGAYAVTSRPAPTGTRSYSESDLERLMQGVFVAARPAIVQLQTIGVEETPRDSNDLPRSITVSSGRATGFFISSDGYVLTAYHAVSGQTRLNVLTTRQQLLSATVVGFDQTRDLAMLKVNVTGRVPFLDLELTRSVKSGEPLVEVGNAEEDFMQPRYGVAQEFEQDAGNLVPTRLLYATIGLNPGDSGGAVLDFHGRVVAVGIGYATSDVRRVALLVPLEGMTQDLSALKNGVRVRLPSIGLHVVHNEDGGVKIDRVEPRSSAAEIGLNGGIVTKLDGKTVDSQSDYYRLLRAKRQGEAVQVTIRNKASEFTYTLELR